MDDRVRRYDRRHRAHHDGQRSVRGFHMQRSRCIYPGL